MDLIDKIHDIAAQVSKLSDHLKNNEEATKTALIMPFITALGYNVFDPTEVVPEFTCDVGTKRGEKVDYAIKKDGTLIVLIECKSLDSELTLEHASQLYRYFSVTEARFAILTDGNTYHFYSDLDAPNKMDNKPFLVFSLSEFPDALVDELKKFTKPVFDVASIVSTASQLKYTREMKRILADQLTKPDEDFVRLLGSRVYSGRMTQSVIEQFTAFTRHALREFINEQVNNRLKSALVAEKEATQELEAVTDAEDASTADETTDRQIETTQEELDGYLVIKAILRSTVDVKRVVMRDAKSYCAILLDDNNRKPICRLHFNRNQKYVGLFNEDKEENRVPIDNLDDIYQHAEQLITIVQFYDAE